MRRVYLGHKIVRSIYLDESGTHEKATFLSVAGVIIHPDQQWQAISDRLEALRHKHLPPEDQTGFAFHATDLFHGSRYFDRRHPKWADKDLRWSILAELAQIIDDLDLPVVAGTYQKNKFGLGLLPPEDINKRLIQNVAAMDCLIWADRWLGINAPGEVAVVVHEDGTEAKALMKHSARLLQSAALLDAAELGEDVRKEFGLPLMRIIDDINFVEKNRTPPLQLADLCAFILGRAMQDKEVPEDVFEIVWKHLKWIPEAATKAKTTSASLVVPV